jgi:autotransporter translocation and assembly factor TamB
MTGLVKGLKRVLLAVIVLAALATASLLVYVRTDSFARLLQSRVGDLLNTEFRGKITMDRIDTSVADELIIHGLRIKYRDATIVWIPRIQVAYSLIPLLWREVRIGIAANDPVIDLRREADGDWNLMKALASETPTATSSGASSFSIYIHNLGIRQGIVKIAPQGTSGPRYRFDRTDLDGSIAIKPAGLDAELRSLRTRVAAPALPPADLYAALFYRDVSHPAKLAITALRLTTRASALSLTGTVRDMEALRTDVEVTIERLASSDVSMILPDDPLSADLSGRISLEGTAKQMRTKADLAAGKARLRGNFLIDLTRTAPSFDGGLALTQLDLGALALPQKLAGILEMTLNARGQAANLKALVAKTTINVDRLRAGTIEAGNLRFIGGAQQGNVQLDGNLSRGSERLKLNCNALVVGNPRYELVAETEHLNAAQLSKGAPSTDLNSRTTIQGSGRELKTIDAKIDFRTVHSSVANRPVDSLIRAQLKGGVVDISQARILSQGTDLALQGNVGMIPGSATRLSYRLRADRIAPWLRLAATTGDGRLLLDGTALGTLRGAKGTALRTQGKIDLESLQLSDLRIDSGHANYSFDRIGSGGWPRGDADLRLTALKTNGFELRAISARARLDGGRPPHITVAMTVHDRKNNADRLAATIIYQPNHIAGSVDQLSLMLPDGAWRMTDQARFTKDQHRVEVRHLALVNGVHSLTFDGRMGSAGAQEASLHVHALDLAVLRPLMSRSERIGGDLSADISLSGTSTAPVIDMNLTVNRLLINSQMLGDVNAAANYKPSKAALDATFSQDQNHRLRLNGDVPIKLEWSHGFMAKIGNDQKIRAYSAGIRLAPFAGIAPQTLRNPAGLLRADLELTGPPLHPSINGTMAITRAAGEVVPVGVKISDLEVGLRASPSRIEITELSAKAADGTLNGSGSIALKNNYSPGAINATIQMQKWPAIATREYNASIDGELRASGTPDAPDLRGTIDVVDTTIRPDLDFLTGPSVPPPDQTIVVVRSGEPKLPDRSEALSHAPGETSVAVSNDQHANGLTFNNSAIDLKVNVHRNTWIRHDNAQIELDGNLNIRKSRGGPITVVGEIDTVRGWILFHGRRFTLENGQILFSGGHQIDPTLNIDAQYTVSTYVIDVIVTGTASKPELKLKSQPELAQGDILSLILFGTTTSQLGQGQKATLQQQAQSLAAGAAGQALSESLGLSSLGVSVSGQSVGLGHYLNENTYVSFSPSLGATGSKTPSPVASVQYFLWRWLALTTATMSDGSSQVFLNVNKRY